MKVHCFLLAVPLLCSCCLGDPPSTAPSHAERRDFEVTAAAPELPALKYQLTFDSTQLLPGNAAPVYLQALLMLSEVDEHTIDGALDAHNAGKPVVDNPKVKGLLQLNGLLDLLDIASHRQQCDWALPMQERGLRTLLPQLNGLREADRFLQVRGIAQIETGKIEDALQTIRMEYALGHNTAAGSPLVCGLVGVAICSVGNSLVADLASRADCPNLYWPIMNVAHTQISLREAMDNERQWLLAQVPVLAKGKTGGITAEDWNAFISQSSMIPALGQPQAPGQSQPSAEELTERLKTLLPAREYYAATRHISFEEASKCDGNLVMATYFIEQYQIAADEQAKILDLPLNQTIELAQKMPERLKQLGVNSSNVGCILAPALKRIPITFGREERQIAALAAIQALRAYAADHSGQLPATLADVLETPVPVNPMSGKMFEYRLENGTASISDTESLGASDGYSLVYTLRISKP